MTDDLARSERAVKRAERWMERLERLVAERPDDAKARYLLGRTRYQAVQALQEYYFFRHRYGLEEKSWSDVLQNLSSHEHFQQSLREQQWVCEPLRRALEIDSTLWKTWCLLGEVLWHSMNPETQKALQQAIALNPRCVSARLRLGHMKSEVG